MKTVLEVLEQTKEMKVELIAKEFKIGKEKLSATLKSLGAIARRRGGWDYEQVEKSVLNKPITDFLSTTKSVQKETTNEQKNINTKERKSVIIKEKKFEVEKEEKPKLRKRASFDIDAQLLKELKIFAINEDKNVYEVVENAIRNYLNEHK